MSLAGWLLNLIYLGLLSAVSPVLLYRAIVHGKYRRGWREKLLGGPPRRTSTGPCVWLHAVSVGEVLLLRTVIERLKRVDGELDIWISTTTDTGHTVATEQFPDCRVVYFPLDFTWAVRSALERVRPDVVGLAELELWPNFIRAVEGQRIPLVLINGRISDRSFRGYRRIRFLMRPTLRRFEALGVQTEEHRRRLMQLGACGRRTVVTGSVKFDACGSRSSELRTGELRRELGIEPGEPVFVGGSTHPPEEKFVLECYRALREEIPGLRLVIAPRHRERFDEVAKLIQERGLSVVRRSGTGSNRSASEDHDRPVILWDTLGELHRGWGLADAAFVGGSLSQRGGQNMLEPCGLGAAVVVGPNTWNFREAVELLHAGKAICVAGNQDELLKAVRRLLTDRDGAAAMGARARGIVRAHQGATAKTVDLLLEAMGVQASGLPRAAA